MMTFSLRRLAGAFAWLAASSALSAADEALPKIFNGQDLAGWKVPATNLIWKVADGVLIGQSDDKKTGSMLYTERSYSNFVFETEVRWKGDCDSGVMFRKPELQLQFGISRSLKVDMTCAFYTGGKDAYPMAGRPKNMEKLFKPEDWNRVRLQVIGDTATVWLNGEQVCAPMAPISDAQVVTLQPGVHRLRVEADTKDAWYHIGAYYEFSMHLQPE